MNPQDAPEVEEATEEPPAEPEEQEKTAQTAEPELVEEERTLTQVEVAEPSPPAPAPKKRGRPPKAKAEAKAPAKAPGLQLLPRAPRRKIVSELLGDSDSSTDVEETLRNVYRHVAKPDMETAILQFLVNRKQSEQTRRRELWSQLAKF